MRVQNKKGFTLIELIVVIVIIGILAAVAVPAFVNLITQAQAGAVKGKLGAIRSAIVMRYGESMASNAATGGYPDGLTDDMFDGSGVPENDITQLTDVLLVSAVVVAGDLDVDEGWIYCTAAACGDGRVWAAIGLAPPDGVTTGDAFDW